MRKTNVLQNDPYLSGFGIRTATDAARIKRVLLMEDNRSDAYLLKSMLGEVEEDTHFSFTVLPRLADGLSMLERGQRFDLVILDLGLLDAEDASSVALIQAVAPNIPIIVYSANEDPSLVDEALGLGASHYLFKGHESACSLKFFILSTLSYAQV